MLQTIIQINDATKQTLIFGLYMIATLLISPISETHHLINLFPSVLVITFTLLFQSKKNFLTGVLILSVAFVSLITRKIYFESSIIAVLALYGLTFWILFQPIDLATTYNKQNNKALTFDKGS